MAKQATDYVIETLIGHIELEAHLIERITELQLKIWYRQQSMATQTGEARKYSRAYIVKRKRELRNAERRIDASINARKRFIGHDRATRQQVYNSLVA